LDLGGIDGVVFDIGGVLTLPNRSVIERNLRLTGCREAIDTDAFEQAHYSGLRG